MGAIGIISSESSSIQKLFLNLGLNILLSESYKKKNTLSFKKIIKWYIRLLIGALSA